MNQALFRQVNERVRELNETFATFSVVMQTVCECGNSSCIQRLSISRSEYEHLRRDPTRFTVVPGHAVADVELVIATHPEYHVVQKRTGAPAQLLPDLDPRNRFRTRKFAFAFHPQFVSC